ncbi:hypothetical protein BOTBODRAFT_37559 [Botryobasidium botryosum FD-172 SS1]|uniref:Uncharacterized protein n=1 Tax=Botryobasidium botryosum (strain FD-172 SS1) TaxID=930990 RepID=A0A067MBB1_BOTB1|nr:hypothetical protein BOTBODRAFT_37559 [Botryobasidium botryosum FD-172 SS1]
MPAIPATDATKRPIRAAPSYMNPLNRTAGTARMPSKKPPGKTASSVRLVNGPQKAGPRIQATSRVQPSSTRSVTTAKESARDTPTAITSSSKPRSSTIELEGPSQPAPKPPPNIPMKAVASETDLLQLVSQLYSWLYMRSTFNDTLNKARIKTDSKLRSREDELKDEEASIAEAKMRFELDEEIAFLDELSTEHAHNLPETLQRYVELNRASGKAIRSALELVNPAHTSKKPSTFDPGQYQKCLEIFDTFQEEARKVHSLIDTLVRALSSSRSKLHGIMESLLGVLSERMGHIALARRVVGDARDFERRKLHLESLALSV